MTLPSANEQFVCAVYVSEVQLKVKNCLVFLSFFDFLKNASIRSLNLLVIRDEGFSLTF